MDQDLINVLLGFTAIAAVATPICLLIDRYRKRRDKEYFEKLLKGEAENPCIDAVKKRSGIIEFIDGMIKYQFQDQVTWELAVSEIKVIGEYTNQNGPFADDYFYVFITNLDVWYEASFYAHGRDSFFRKLGAELHQELHGTLVASADFNSNIIWPPSLAGKEMFEFRKEGWLGKLGLANKQYFSQEVIDFVKQ
ncbi:MAG: hypothetical protein K9M75_12835 [Phycisphaerae bacterium]|nr:hypothetical protein [Phycisphaerae bacterium]